MDPSCSVMQYLHRPCSMATRQYACPLRHAQQGNTPPWHGGTAHSHAQQDLPTRLAGTAGAACVAHALRCGTAGSMHHPAAGPACCRRCGARRVLTAAWAPACAAASSTGAPLQGPQGQAALGIGLTPSCRTCPGTCAQAGWQRVRQRAACSGGSVEPQATSKPRCTQTGVLAGL